MQSGFTLLELMTTLAIVAILATVAMPSMQSFARNNRLSSAANDLLHSLQLARTEAIKRQQGNMVVCACDSPDAADTALACSHGAFTGWFVFADINGDWTHDAGEPVLEKHAAVASQVLVSSDHDGIVSYGPTGFANPPGGGKTPTANVAICDHRTNPLQGTDSTARAVLIANTGRARVTRVATEVSAALAATGGTCPP